MSKQFKKLPLRAARHNNRKTWFYKMFNMHQMRTTECDPGRIFTGSNILDCS